MDVSHLGGIHHPPVPDRQPSLRDAVSLQQPERLLTLLTGKSAGQGVVFGHVHQHWAGTCRCDRRCPCSPALFQPLRL